MLKNQREIRSPRVRVSCKIVSASHYSCKLSAIVFFFQFQKSAPPFTNRIKFVPDLLRSYNLDGALHFYDKYCIKGMTFTKAK